MYMYSYRRLHQKRVSQALVLRLVQRDPDDDGVYYYIGERLKLEGDTGCSHWRGHSTRVCTPSSVYPQHQLGI